MRFSKQFLPLTALTVSATLLCVSTLSAAPALRKQVSQHGDFAVIGNAGGFECAPGTPAPLVGTVMCPATGNADSAPDIFFRSEEPNATSAVANATITSLTSRTTALLALPAGATVTYARVYWAGFLPAATAADTKLTIERPGGTLNEVVTADASAVVPRAAFHWYQSTADVTTLVAAAGSGTYRISDIASVELPTLLDNNDPINAWALVVFYSLPSDPPRNLALFDGLDLVLPGTSANATLSGFLVPNSGFDAKLGVIAYEGEQSLGGDGLSFNGAALSNLVNPVNNFFNSSHSFLGTAVSVVGDLPQLAGTPGSMNGFDLDVVDVKAQLHANDVSATISASSTTDTYLLGGFITSISTFQPDFSASNKVFTDLNGGSILPEDVLEYVIKAVNNGNDASLNTVVTDALPMGITYVPGSLQITAGDNVGLKTDAKDTDQGEYDALTRTLTVRVGAGANGTAGGSVAIDGSSEIRFRVTVDANATGSILNQAVVTGGGAQGAPPSNFPTDGNGTAPGTPPTTVVVDKCNSNADCTLPNGVCDTSVSPKVCVGCAKDSDCTDPTAPQCNTTMHVCGCSMNCGDSDMDGIPDSVEVTIGTDPNDADSDDDGVPDGQEPSASADTDGDGLINALDSDSDNDGLFDGTELGLDCSNPDTKANLGHCRPDADKGKTKTDPLDPDTDHGGVSDGSEDFNLDGAVDSGETDPSAGHGGDDKGVKDTDKDGLSDGLEGFLGSNPNDADSDDDGVRDGAEANPSDDTDGDGLKNVLDVDSDNDALFDGTESGKNCNDPATDKKLGHCVADADSGATLTSPLDPDTDHGKVKDGSEDFDHNGVVDGKETDPTLGHGADDKTITDHDGDGLSDDAETMLGTDPEDADSDNDGVLDGAEPNPGDDSDGDGLINALDPDSDNDGLFDGTELGLGCDDPATDKAAKTCVPDGDNGTTRTSPLIADTDHGGVSDGDEDLNHNGVVDGGETDPNDPADDHVPPGAGGASGEGGEEAGASGSGATGTGASSGMGASAGLGAGGFGNPGVLEGGGCSCRTAPGDGGALSGLALGLAGLGLFVTRRRKRG
jgi:clumping factor A